MHVKADSHALYIYVAKYMYSHVLFGGYHVHEPTYCTIMYMYVLRKQICLASNYLELVCNVLVHIETFKIFWDACAWLNWLNDGSITTILLFNLHIWPRVKYSPVGDSGTIPLASYKK